VNSCGCLDNGEIFKLLNELDLPIAHLSHILLVTWHCFVQCVLSQASIFHLTKQKYFGKALRGVYTVLYCEFTMTLDSWMLDAKIVVDGNFKAENLVTKRLDQDVTLRDGEGYMVTDSPYREHLKVATEMIPVSFSR
jgi:hypothetical protein